MRTALSTGFSVLLLLGAAASAPIGAPPPGAPVQSPDQVASAGRVITPSMMLDHVKALAADDKEGRAPGTVGEERTVAYLVEPVQAPRTGAGQSRRHLRAARCRSSAFTGEADGRVRREGRRIAAGDSGRSGGGVAAGTARRDAWRSPRWSSSATASSRPNSTGTTSRASTSAARRSSCWSAIRRCRIRPIRRRSIRRPSRARP